MTRRTVIECGWLVSMDPEIGEPADVQLLVEDDRVERLMIQPVLEDRDNIEPVGLLNEGDRIVVAGQAGLKDGSLVREVGIGPNEPEQAEDGEQAAG